MSESRILRTRRFLTMCFIESAPAALRALRANIAACKADDRTEILAMDVLAIAGARRPATIAFLDPPYGLSLVPRAVGRLRDVGRIGPGTLIVAEVGRDEAWHPDQPVLAERHHGAARIVVFRAL